MTRSSVNGEAFYLIVRHIDLFNHAEDNNDWM